MLCARHLSPGVDQISVVKILGGDNLRVLLQGQIKRQLLFVRFEGDDLPQLILGDL